jgi:hypothetical protein
MIKRTIALLALAAAACSTPAAKVPTKQIRAHADQGQQQLNQEIRTPHPAQP